MLSLRNKFIVFVLIFTSMIPSAFSQSPPQESELFTKEGQKELEKEGYIFEREEEVYNDTTSVILALTLGMFAHGSGHFYAGDSKTGFTLLGMEILSLSLLTGALIADANSEGENTAIIAPLMQAGFSLFVFSYLADVVGSISGPKAALAAKPWRDNETLDFSALYNFTASRGSPYRHALNARLELDTRFVDLSAATIQEVFLETSDYQGSAQVHYSSSAGHSKVGAEIFAEYLVHSGRGPFSKTSGNVRAIAQLDLGDFFKQLRGFVIGIEAGFGMNWWSFANDENQFVVQKTGNYYPIDFYASAQLTPKLHISGGYGYTKNPTISPITSLLGVAHLETSFETTKLLKLLFEVQVGDGFSGSLGASINIF